jgi:hypothetical protein
MRHILTSLRLLILAAAICSAIPATAQPGITSEGREFWLGFMPNYITPAQAISIYVGSAVANDFKVETFGAGGSIVRSQSIRLGAGQSYKFSMSVGISETRDREVPVYHAIRVTSSSPSTVVGYSDNSLTTDGFLAIPTPALGFEHYCLSYFDDSYSPGIDHLGGEFLVVAPYDDTKVTITTTAKTSLSDDGKAIGHTPGQTWTVNLKKGQTYLVQSAGWEYGVGDLTGSKITSNKPVGFLSGHQRAEIELEDGSSKDHLLEMIPSTDHWGIEYFGIPQNSRTKCGNYYRVMSAENGNVIKVNDSTVTLDAGEYAAFSQMTDVVHFISTNKKRFLAMEYFYSEGHFGDPGPGDPDMLTLTPTSGFVTHAVFRTPSNAGTAFRHYATFVAATNGINSLRLKKGNSAPISVAALGGSIAPIENTSYSFARILMPGDEVSWFAECDVPFSLDLYGYANVESYGYPGSRSFAALSDSIPPRYEVLYSDGCGSIQVKIRDNTGIQGLSLVSLSDTALYHTSAFTLNFGMVVPPEFTLGDTSVILTFYVLDGTKPATLALYFVDKGGNDSIYTSTYSVKKIEWAIDSAFPPIARLGDTICRTVTYWNRSSDSLYLYPYVSGNRPAFHTPQINDLRLGPNDSVKIEVCFIPEDTLTYTDSIKVITDCYNDGFLATSRAVQAKLTATDSYFGLVHKDEEICMGIVLGNAGEIPITITGYERTGDTAFTVISPAFPFVLQPDASQDVTVCYKTSRDSGDSQARFDWILEKPTDLWKTYSIVSAIVRDPLRVNAAHGDLNIWPNPASGYLSIALPENQKLLSVHAVDVRGAEQALTFEVVSGRASVNTIDLVSGVYTILIRTSEGQYTRQLVINH